VLELFAVFSYGLAAASQLFNGNNCKYTSLCNYEILVKQAVALGYIDKTEADKLGQWHLNPQIWSEQVMEKEKK